MEGNLWRFNGATVVLVPFPFTDLSATKTRPAVIVSGDIYHVHRSELLLAYVSSQITKANPVLDHILMDWKTEGLPRPSFVRPKIASIESSLVVYQAGKLSSRDLFEVDRLLRRAMALNETALADIVAEVDLKRQAPALLQEIAEKASSALKTVPDS